LFERMRNWIPNWRTYCWRAIHKEDRNKREIASASLIFVITVAIISGRVIAILLFVLSQTKQINWYCMQLDSWDKKVQTEWWDRSPFTPFYNQKLWNFAFTNLRTLFNAVKLNCFDFVKILSIMRSVHLILYRHHAFLKIFRVRFIYCIPLSFARFYIKDQLFFFKSCGASVYKHLY
jgi:hypothetical protein